MNEKNPLANLVNFGLILATGGGGVVAMHNLLDSSRPTDTVATTHGGRSRPHKVRSRLWQDPFEPFGFLTNRDESTPITTSRYFLGAGTNDVLRVEKTRSDRTDNPESDAGFWKNIVTDHPNTNGAISILGVMLPGGPYQADKEVRMRLRYAVELALLTKNLGPEDGTHIFDAQVSTESKDRV